MNKTLFFFLIMLPCISSAQKMLVFTNPVKEKVIEVKEGHTLSIQYRGYLGQTEFAKNAVSAINDSMVVLGVDPEKLPAMMRYNQQLIGSYKIVRISDITGFRRMTAGRQVLKAAATIGMVVGSYFLLYDVYRDPAIRTGPALLISLGVVIGSRLVLNTALPENVKYYMEDGWHVTVTERK